MLKGETNGDYKQLFSIFKLLAPNKADPDKRQEWRGKALSFSMKIQRAKTLADFWDQTNQLQRSFFKEKKKK